MSLNWRKGVDPTGLLSHLQAHRSQDRTGKVGYTNILLDEEAFILSSAVEMNDNLSPIDRQRLVVQALFSPIAKEASFAEGILKAIEQKQLEYYRLPLRTLVTVSSLSVRGIAGIPIIEILPGVFVSFPRKFDRRMRKARESLLGEIPSFALPELPLGYQIVRIRTITRTEHEAVERALDGLDLLRAIWNLYFNRAIGLRRSSAHGMAPVNKVLLGVFHTVHVASGATASGEYWYQPEYQKPAAPFDMKPHTDGLLRFTRNVRRLLSKSNYGATIQRALLQYVRALDRGDMQDSFQRLWAVLELLTDAQRHELVVKRASAIWADSSLARLTLDNLRTLRNSLVHEGRDAIEGEICVFQAKRYVEALLEFHLGRSLEIDSVAEAAEFLDLHEYLTKASAKSRLFKDAKRYYAPRRSSAA